MAEKNETPAPDPKWEDDPYRGVDVSMMQELLKLTPAERLRLAVEASNNLRRFREAAQRSLRRG